MKLQVADCVLAALLGALFVVNVQGFIFQKPERQLCEAFGEPCISYDINSPIGPRCWFKVDIPREKCCNEKGKLQSPIDIPDVKHFYKVPRKLRYSSDKFPGHMENTGIQPIFKAEEDADKVFLEGIGSPDGKRYFLINVHFHVGVDREERQTENTLNGRSFDGESHIVHIREDFGTLREAAQHPQGILVIAIFLKTSGRGKRSEAFDKLIEIIPEVKKFDAEDGPCANVHVRPFDHFRKIIGIFPHIPHFPFCRISFAPDGDAADTSGDRCNLYLPNGQCGDRTEATINPNELLADVPEYYLFEGGLTSPPCSEALVWFVAKQPREVSFFYPFVVRSLHTQIKGETIGNFGNLRPLQDLEGRRVYLLRFRYRYWWKHSSHIGITEEASDADGADGPLAALGLH